MNDQELPQEPLDDKYAPERIVELFNLLGYEQTFATIALQGDLDLSGLYSRYPSREWLGEAWLSRFIPSTAAGTLRDMFETLVMDVLDALEKYRDFSRAWLDSLAGLGHLHLTSLERLHTESRTYFLAWLDANEQSISLPGQLYSRDVKYEIADVMCACLAFLIMHWHGDRSHSFARTQELCKSIASLLDGFLMCRHEFDNAGLLFHLHRVAGHQTERFVIPLLNMVLPPDRVSRWVHPVSLLELLRRFGATA
jgi:hypothetical protein